MNAIDHLRFCRREKGLGPGRKPALALTAIATVITLCTITLFVVGAYNRNLGGKPDMKLPEAPSVSTQPHPAPGSVRSLQTQGDIKAIAITLYRQGFETSEIARTGDRFLLAVINRCGLPNITVALKTKSGATIRQVQMQREEPQWGDILDLLPGEYILGVEERPEWSCKITITGG